MPERAVEPVDHEIDRGRCRGGVGVTDIAAPERAPWHPLRAVPPPGPQCAVVAADEDVDGVRIARNRARTRREAAAEWLPTRPTGTEPRLVPELVVLTADEHVE